MFSEKLKIVPVMNYGNLDAGETLYADSINMANFHKATFILQFIGLGTADTCIWMYSGATDASYSSALPFKYAYGGAATGSANCDKLGAWSSNLSGGIPIAVSPANATYTNSMMVIEVNADDMDIANGEKWLSLGFLDTLTNAAGRVVAFAILEPRYTGNRSASALA